MTVETENVRTLSGKWITRKIFRKADVDLKIEKKLAELRAEVTAEKRAERAKRKLKDRVPLAVCHAKGCTREPGHDKNRHGTVEANGLPRSHRRVSGYRDTRPGSVVLHKRKPARPSGVALASPTSRTGKAQRV